MTEVRVLIVEDEPVIAENIALCLNNNDFMVSGIAYDNEEARKQLIQNTPDAVLMDINLGSDEDWIDLARFINKNYKACGSFIFTRSTKLFNRSH